MKIRMLAALVLLLTSASIFAQDPNVPNSVLIEKITNAEEPATNGIVRFTFAQAKQTVCTIDYTITGDTGAITFDPLATSIDMPSNSTTVDLQIVPADNDVVDVARSVRVTVDTVSCASIDVPDPKPFADVSILDNEASLTVIKHVVNDNGGSASASEWTMDVTANNPSSNNFAGAESPGTVITITTGDFSVDESGGPSGYTKTLGAGCSDTAVGGGSYSCTITNDDLPASLTVIKHVVNDGGGSAVASNWLMNVTAANGNQSFPGAESPGVTISIDAGGYNVDESAGPAGYSKDLGTGCSGTAVNGGFYSCTITNTFVPVTTTTTAATTTTTTAATTTTTTAAPTTTTTAATTTTTTAAPTTTTTAGPTTTTTAVATTTTTSAPTTTTTLPNIREISLVIIPDVSTFGTVGEVIQYIYRVENTSLVPVAGPVAVDSNISTDEACPPVNTVGNNDNNLDPSEVIVCTSSYTVVQADIDNGSITNTATANGDGGATTTNTAISTVQSAGVPPVTDDYIAIPTLTEWAMALLAFLFLMVAMTYLRRKQVV